MCIFSMWIDNCCIVWYKRHYVQRAVSPPNNEGYMAHATIIVVRRFDEDTADEQATEQSRLISLYLRQMGIFPHMLWHCTAGENTALQLRSCEHMGDIVIHAENLDEDTTALEMLDDLLETGGGEHILIAHATVTDALLNRGRHTRTEWIKDPGGIATMVFEAPSNGANTLRVVSLPLAIQPWVMGSPSSI